MRVFPSFCFGYAIINISNKSIYATVIGKKTPYEIYDMDIAGGDVLMLGIFNVVFLVLVFFMEYMQNKKTIMKF